MINKTKHFAYTIRVPESEIIGIIENIDKFYTEIVKYKTGKDGSPIVDSRGRRKSRVLNPSQRRLKVIQKRIQRNILLKLKLPDYAYGSVKGRDNVINANEHKGKRFLFTTDLRNFFPSINNSKVFEMFRLYNFSPEVSRLLTQLTTYKGRLPQGAPTSSTIANLVFVKTGNNLDLFARKHNITFTSFVDDLTFSSPTDFKDKSEEIIEIITKDGFKISHNKTSYSSNSIITGIHPKNNYLKLPENFLRKLKNTSSMSDEQKRGLNLYKKKVDDLNYSKKK